MPPKKLILQPLPPLKDIEKVKDVYMGPTMYSNFIIPNVLLTGSYPDHKNELKTLMEHGFTTFVSLEEHFQAQIGTKAKQIKDYKRQGEIYAREMKTTFKHHAFHISNFDKNNTAPLMQFILDKVLKSIDRGEKVYLHDFGGAGRSGVVSAIIIGILYGIGGGECLGYIGKWHALRQSTSTNSSPENTSQRLMVYHIVDNVLKDTKIPQWRNIRLLGSGDVNDNVSETKSIRGSVARESKGDTESLLLSPSSDCTDNTSKFFDDHSPLKSPLSNQFDDDIDLLNNDNIMEFTDMPPEKRNFHSNGNTQLFENLPKLPDQPPVADKSMRGPLPESSWLVKGRVCVGAFPIDTRFGHQKNRHLAIDAKSEACLPVRKLLDAGINVFVCLQAEIPILTNKETDEASFVSYNTNLQMQQRYGFKERAGYTPYFDVVRDISTKEYKRKVTFIHFPIEEGNVCRAEYCSKLLEDLIERIKLNQRIYIHAGTGHNRECMVGAGLLAELFNMTPSDSIRLMSDLHNQREDTKGVTTPLSNHLQKMGVLQMVNARRGIVSDRITTSSRIQAQRDSEFSTGNQNRTKNTTTSIIFG